MTDSEDIINRYKKAFEAHDSRGRTFRMFRLKLSQQSRLIEFTENPLNRFNFNVVASVNNYTDESGNIVAMPFPKTIEHLYLHMDALGEEGFAVCSQTYIEMNGLAKEKQPAGEAGEEDAENA